MLAREAIRNSLNSADSVVRGYLEDLRDDELLVRPVPGANHIAWQLGHLISSEYEMIETACPGSMPALPQRFREQHARDAASRDDAGSFRTKQDYLHLYGQQRAATLEALMRLADEDLDRPGPEQFRGYAATLGDVFITQGGHWLMHAGQWVIVRRKLGRAPLY